MENKIQAYRYGETRRRVPLDPGILIPAILLAAVGLVMVGSASVAIAEAQSLPAYHYLVRHLMYLILGVGLALVFRVISTRHLEYISQPMMLIGLLLLCTVFVPGLGKTVNGSARWIDLGLANFQVVEAAKLALIIYMAGYLVKRGEMLRHRFFDTLKPLLIAGLYTFALLWQPDLGSAVVITLIIGGMVWLAGAAWRHVFILAALASPAFALAGPRASAAVRERRAGSGPGRCAYPRSVGPGALLAPHPTATSVVVALLLPAPEHQRGDSDSE